MSLAELVLPLLVLLVLVLSVADEPSAGGGPPWPP